MVKEITCSGGEVILVDDEDYPVMSRHPWHFTTNGEGNRSYAVTRLNTAQSKSMKTVFMHNMILGFCFNVDHADNNPKNNTKDNLRPATWQENQWNKGKQKTKNGLPCSSKYKGVMYRPLKGRDRWLAQIKHVEHGEPKHTGKMIKLGYFYDEDDAARTYNAKVLELRGEWAWVNPVPNLQSPNKSGVEE